MGSLFSSLFPRTNSKHMRLLMVGLDNAGKTRILYRLKAGAKLNHPLNSGPTIGFNVDTIKCKNTNMTLWDVGGQDHNRPLWKYYFLGTQGLIFVVDSTDRFRINEARTELMSMLAEKELKDVPLLVFANKQDVDDAMTLDELREELSLDSIQCRLWLITPSCALTGDGLNEGLIWLKNPLKYIIKK